MAAQLTARNGPVRPDAAWRAWAAFSLPVPDSPMMRTLALVGPTWRMVRMMDSMASDLPTIGLALAGP